MTPDPSSPIVVQLIDPPMLAHCRRVIEAILVCLRGRRYQRDVAPSLYARVAQLPPATYQWHWLAWQMRGFRRGSQLGYTEDGRVYVSRDGAAWIGDPKTHTVTPLVPDTPATAPATLPVAAQPSLDAMDSVSDLVH